MAVTVQTSHLGIGSAVAFVVGRIMFGLLPAILLGIVVMVFLGIIKVS